ncbi:hypothetical protein IW262DRAFT_1335430 [Armillaria fumosa]|nr:hypothetical protein IW262DRAFT_1335430 [Armillaria fumosa]
MAGLCPCPDVPSNNLKGIAYSEIPRFQRYVAIFLEHKKRLQASEFMWGPSAFKTKKKAPDNDNLRQANICYGSNTRRHCIRSDYDSFFSCSCTIFPLLQTEARSPRSTTSSTSSSTQYYSRGNLPDYLFSSFFLLGFLFTPLYFFCVSCGGWVWLVMLRPVYDYAVPFVGIFRMKCVRVYDIKKSDHTDTTTLFEPSRYPIRK